MKTSVIIRALACASIAAVAAMTARGQIYITEFFYQGYGGTIGGEHEFVELTNVGTTAIDVTGWRYDDDSADFASGFDLSALGVIAPGQSVIFTDISEADFRLVWPDLDSNVVVLGGVSPGLGNGDSIVIFNANQEIVDRLDYTDDPRWRRVTGITSYDNLGENSIAGWYFSDNSAAWFDGLSVNNLASINGDTGNPGYVNFALSTVPEPATYAAIFGGLALAGVMLARRRRATGQ